MRDITLQIVKIIFMKWFQDFGGVLENGALIRKSCEKLFKKIYTEENFQQVIQL